MAHPEQEASDAPVTYTVDSATAALSQAFQNEPEDEQDEGEEEDYSDELDDADTGEGDSDEENEGDEESDEQEDPAIDAPVSLTADEKAAFSQLPKEAQEFVSSLEQRRNTQVQEATTKAKDAQRQAEQAAASADKQAEARFAEQLKAVVSAFAPQAPNPDHYQSIEQFKRAQAAYNQSIAQHEQFAQQVAQIGVETDEQKAERIKARDAELMKIPEVADEATRDAYIQSAFAVAADLGYDQSEIAENMDANDLKALGLAAKWKADSEKLAKIEARSKERRRDKKTGKFRSLQPGAAQPQGSGNRAYKEASQRLSKSGSMDDAAAALKAIL